MRIFLRSVGISKLLTKHEEPTYHEKKVVAHTDDELSLLYGAADPEESFLLDFFIGSMARDHEAYGCRYRDLTGATLTLYGSKTRNAGWKSASGSPTPSTHAGSTLVPERPALPQPQRDPTNISCLPPVPR